MAGKPMSLAQTFLTCDPESIFRFQKNEVVVSFETLEELDKLRCDTITSTITHDRRLSRPSVLHALEDLTRQAPG
jgi:predicted ribonuclease YlaK